MFGLGMPELIIILVIILVIFGAGKLPQIGSGIGKGIRNFRQSIRGGAETSSDQAKIEKNSNSNSDAPSV